nr:hypothetical protein [Burkholderiales bacterium]
MNNNVARGLLVPLALGLLVTGCEKLDLGKFKKAEPPAAHGQAAPPIVTR